MKRLLLSLMVIGLVVGVAVGATSALFSDTETSTGNTFSTGTIDIAVDGENPWEARESYELLDMKPSYTDYLNFVVHNVGSNPVNLYKTLKNFVGSDPVTTEPECLVEGGSWPSPDGPCASNQSVYDLQNKINYDLRVELYPEEPGEEDEPVWWETIYMDEDGVRLNALGQMYLGMIPADWYMKVIQSYHMPETVGNKYQGDQLTFDIELYAEQLTNTITLENKYEPDTDVSHHIWDGKYAELTYKVKDSEFAYTLTLYGMSAGNYTLVSWENTSTPPDPWWDWGDFAGTTVLGQFAYDGSSVPAVERSLELNADLINAKVWLIPGTVGPAEGATGVSLPWSNPENYLFETGLIDYYDADL